MRKEPKKLICPNCDKDFIITEATKDALPFCSKRCKMVDLGHWLSEKYVVEDTQPSTGKDNEDE